MKFCQALYKEGPDTVQCELYGGHTGPHKNWVWGGDTLVWDCCCDTLNSNCGCKEVPCE